MGISDNELRNRILNTIGGLIDEVSLSGDPDSFVEMDRQVIHVAANGQSRYFKFSANTEGAIGRFVPLADLDPTEHGPEVGQVLSVLSLIVADCPATQNNQPDSAE